MDLYAHIRVVPDEIIETLIKSGFLKSTFKRNVSIYERYLFYRERGNSSLESVAFTAEDFKISERHVYRIINKYSEIDEH